jgi:hypothetical protein
MLDVNSISVKIKIDKGFGKLVRRTCKALRSLAEDGLITIDDMDMFIEKLSTRLNDFITVGMLTKKEK